MKRRLFSLLLTLAMLLSLLPAAHALGEEKLPDEDGYGYTYRFVTRDTIEITAYSGCEAEVVVPAVIDGYTVVGIQSFHNEEGYSTPNIFVRKVTLPGTVTYIADDAFYDSDDWAAKTHFELREIVLPQSLKTIGKNAFYNNYYLQKIDIPAGVTEIGRGAFAKCQNLSDITIRHIRSLTVTRHLSTVLIRHIRSVTIARCTAAVSHASHIRKGNGRSIDECGIIFLLPITCRWNHAI